MDELLKTKYNPARQQARRCPEVARNLEKKYAADKRSQAKLYDRFSVKVRKDSGLLNAMNQAAEKAGVSKNQYVVSAVEKQLREDGFWPGEKKED